MGKIMDRSLPGQSDDRGRAGRREENFVAQMMPSLRFCVAFRRAKTLPGAFLSIHLP